jgi:hypothetical protein
VAVLERTSENVAQSRTNARLIADGVSVSQESSQTFSGDILEQHEGYFTVRDLETGIFGTGREPQAAIDDFQIALREHLELLERQSSLSPDLQAQLHYLRARLN